MACIFRLDRPLLPPCLAAVLAVSAVTQAATNARVTPMPDARSSRPASTSSAAKPAATWHIRNSANLRFLSLTAPIADDTVQACETLRSELCACWLAKEEVTWTPKCDVVLHASEASYLAEVGAAGRKTLASSLVKRAEGRIASRRIDILATRADWYTTSLPHELTHVILADALADLKIPRWLDEGLAILADPADKQFRHGRDLHQALGANAQFRLVELLALEDYPASSRWGTFYGQSASVVGFLAGRDRPARLLELVRVAQQRGYEVALREVYKIDGVRDLERQWIASAKQAELLASGNVKTHSEHIAQPASWRRFAPERTTK